MLASREDELSSQLRDGRRLFEQETFGGNGRTCRTCHSAETGTVSPADAQTRFDANPNDPLFLFDGSDDGEGGGSTRVRAHATIRITIPLPSNVSIPGDPARSVVLLRGIPTTLNTPGLDDVFMVDGRQPNLESQALSAIQGHAQATRQPTPSELSAIATFEKSRPFFSSGRLFAYAVSGKPPALPEGRTDSERRGRRFFVDQPLQMNAAGTAFKLDGTCAHCHSGPLLNKTNAFGLFPPGLEFSTAGASEINEIANPVRTFVFTNPDGTTTQVPSPDPGLALITGNPQDANLFKIPILRGLTKTAPYFHDNSAPTLEALVEHYALFFAGAPTPLPIEPFSQQDKEDLVAFLKLL